MKKKFTTLLLLSTFLFSNVEALKAQYPDRGLFKQWAAGIDILTLYGPGVYGATSLTPNLKARVGFDFLGYKYTDGVSFDADALDVNGNYLDKTLDGDFTKAKLSFPNGKLLVDYYPMANGVFSITAGCYIGGNSISVDGMIDRYDGTSYFEIIDGVSIKPENNGAFSAKLKMGGVVKPYFGLGLGRTIANKRVGFKFDLGVVYQGKLKIESDQSHNISKLEDAVDLPVPESALRFWPMIGFSLSYRIK